MIDRLNLTENSRPRFMKKQQIGGYKFAVAKPFSSEFLFRLGYVYEVSNQRPFHRHHRLVQIGFQGTAALFQTSQLPDFRLSAFRISNSKYFI